MVTKDKIPQRIIVILLKDFSSTHTVSSLAKSLKISRVGVWKVLKKLEAEKLIIIYPAGKGKTSTFILKLNWENILLDKTLALYLTKDALKQKRWRANFTELEIEVDFLILYGSILHDLKEASDIDILSVSKKKKLGKISDIIMKIQKIQFKKIHALNFTHTEFKDELKRKNKAMIDAIKKGTILFGQENFIEFMKDIQER